MSKDIASTVKENITDEQDFLSFVQEMHSKKSATADQPDYQDQQDSYEYQNSSKKAEKAYSTDNYSADDRDEDQEETEDESYLKNSKKKKAENPPGGEISTSSQKTSESEEQLVNVLKEDEDLGEQFVEAYHKFVSENEDFFSTLAEDSENTRDTAAKLVEKYIKEYKVMPSKRTDLLKMIQ